MERRPAPEVTIEGGAGWQLDDAPAVGRPGPGVRDDRGPDLRAGGDELAGGTADDRPVGRTRGWTSLPAAGWRALALAAAVGFVAATALAQVRLSTLRESDAGVLSLDVRVETVDYRLALVEGDGGQPAVSTEVVLRNTGPREVALDSVELVGTPYRSDDLAGRRVAVGGQTVVALLRPVDCAALERTPAPGPLRVRGTTGAGPRTVDLRLSTDVLQVHDDQVRRSCGRAPQGEALVVMEWVPRVEGPRAVVTAELSNASAGQLAVLDVRPREGLRLVRTTDGSGAPVALPLELPPGDYDPPVDPFEGRGPLRLLVLELEVEDCELLRGQESRPGDYTSLVEVLVGGDVPALSGWGGDPNIVSRLLRSGCTDDAAARTAAGPRPTPLTPAEVSAEVYRSAD